MNADLRGLLLASTLYPRASAFIRGWSVLRVDSIWPRKESERYWLSVTLLPDSNDSTAAQANCSARRPAMAGTGGFSPRLNASNMASK
jgi:hypothetical protein